MLTFLMPAALAALALLAIPVIIHLLRPRKVRVIPFSSVRWLRASQHRLTRRIRWHQVLLFLLRAGLLASLVLALAKPVLSRWDRSGRADHLVVVETTPAMDYRSADRPRPMDAIRPSLQALVEQAVAGGRTLLLAAPGSSAPGATPSPAEQARSLKTSVIDARVTDPLPLAPALLGPPDPGAALDVHLFTANLAAGWSRPEIARFLRDRSGPVRVHVVDAGPERPQNAWIREARVHASGEPPRHRVRVFLDSVGEGARDRTLRLAGIRGVADMTRPVTLAPGRPVEVEFELPPGLDAAALTARLSLEPSDELPHDDTWWITLDPRASLNLLVLEPELTQVPEFQPGYPLRKAIEALSDDKGGRLELVQRSDRTVTPGDIEKADIVFMADLPRLADDALAALEQRVRSGGGLAVFSGPSLDLPFYRTRLFDPLHPSGCLLPCPPGDPVDLRAAGQLARLAAVQWTHPLLAGLFDPSYGDLLQASAGIGLRWPAPAEGHGEVLAAFEGIGPAILERRVQAGRVLVFAITANDAWGDLPRRKSFVPLVDRILDRLAGSLRRGMAEAGQPLAAVVPADPSADITFTDPRGAGCTYKRYKAAGRTVVETDRTAEPGVYRVAWRSGGREGQIPLVVQASRRMSAVSRMDPDILRAWWQPAEFEVLKPADLQRRLERGDGRAELDPWLMLLAAGFFLAEMVYVHRLCPRGLSPVVHRPVIAQGGFFRPGGPGEEA